MLRFGTDGVRGVAGRELTAELVLALGRAAARALGTGRPFLVARDTRLSGPMIEAALVAGLGSEGAGAELLGVLPTPGLAAACAAAGAPGAMISASHNPFPDNGVKFFEPGGRKLRDATEERIEAELASLLAESPPGSEGRSIGTVVARGGAGDADEARAAVAHSPARDPHGGVDRGGGGGHRLPGRRAPRWYARGGRLRQRRRVGGGPAGVAGPGGEGHRDVGRPRRHEHQRPLRVDVHRAAPGPGGRRGRRRGARLRRRRRPRRRRRRDRRDRRRRPHPRRRGSGPRRAGPPAQPGRRHDGHGQPGPAPGAGAARHRSGRDARRRPSRARRDGGARPRARGRAVRARHLRRPRRHRRRPAHGDPAPRRRRAVRASPVGAGVGDDPPPPGAPQRRGGLPRQPRRRDGLLVGGP
ncbi:MAG: hypothetical protein KJ056_10250 [Acidimicrobiia bacterium]|nr:hypothetical protein [Acidimicrobiia bacterium]